MPKKCSVQNCEGESLARELCPMHYARWRRNGSPYIRKGAELQGRPVKGVSRSISLNCGVCEAPFAVSLSKLPAYFCSRKCAGEAQRGKGLSNEERFWKGVSKNGPVHPYHPELGKCWPWTLSTRSGYGAFPIKKENGEWTIVGAHRFSYELENGPIDLGISVLHSCDYRPCVRPSHLFDGTQLDNVEDMIAKGRVAILPNAILTAEDVREIRRRRSEGETQSSLANAYGVARATISLAERGVTWKNVDR